MSGQSRLNGSALKVLGFVLALVVAVSTAVYAVAQNSTLIVEQRVSIEKNSRLIEVNDKRVDKVTECLIEVRGDIRAIRVLLERYTKDRKGASNEATDLGGGVDRMSSPDGGLYLRQAFRSRTDHYLSSSGRRDR